MSTSKHILVVGSGIIGASIAWHLVAAGAAVTVVAAGAVGGVATPCSFAWINASAGNPAPYFRLRLRAMAEWRRLAQALPDLPLAWTGGLCWDLPPAKLEAYAEEHGGWGYGISRVDRAAASLIEPALADPPDFAVHVAGEGAVEPDQAARLLLLDAERHGARVLADTAVTGLAVAGGRVVGVETASGILPADEVVLAAGIGTAKLAATAGVTLHLTAPPGLLVHSAPHAPLLRGLVMAPSLHMRQTEEGRIVAGADYGGTDPGADPAEAAHALLARIKALLCGAADLALARHTIGYRPTPRDGFPVVGRPDGVAGLTLAVMHSGITLAPAIGRFVAEELLSGRRDPLLAPYGVR